MGEAQREKTHNFQTTSALDEMATILEPGDAQSPILTKAIQHVMANWLIEIGAKKEMKEIGLEPRSKAIFHGAPGCGKTTLVHHIGARLGIPIVLVNMQMIVGSYIGQTGRNIDALFRELHPQYDQCIVFMDEFDSLAQKRMQVERSIDQERNSIVTALLQKMDDYKGILVAATNIETGIDPAIWRRFNMHIKIDPPDVDCRFAILKRYLEPFQLVDEAIDVLVASTAGATPALMKALAEQIKRDMVLGDRLRIPKDPVSMMGRVVISAVPHGDAALPPLWKDHRTYGEKLLPFWPPERKK